MGYLGVVVAIVHKFGSYGRTLQCPSPFQAKTGWHVDAAWSGPCLDVLHMPALGPSPSTELARKYDYHTTISLEHKSIHPSAVSIVFKLSSDLLHPSLTAITTFCNSVFLSSLLYLLNG